MDGMRQESALSHADEPVEVWRLWFAREAEMIAEARAQLGVGYGPYGSRSGQLAQRLGRRRPSKVVSLPLQGGGPYLAPSDPTKGELRTQAF